MTILNGQLFSDYISRLPRSNSSLADVKNKMISIVDNEGDISALLRLGVNEKIEGYKVFAFNDPSLALQHFVENKSAYALVITDLRMSGLNGLELLKKVKELNSGVRTILMSGYNFDQVKFFQEYKEQLIIDSTIEKPVTIQKLIHKVRDELQIYQLLNFTTDLNIQ